MLDVDNVTPFLLESGLIDGESILGGDYVVASAARRNRNLRVQVGGAGYLLKQPGDPTEGGHTTLRAEAAFYAFCQAEPRAAPMCEILPRLAYCDPSGPLLGLELYADAQPLWMAMSATGPQSTTRQAARALGRALGTFHRVFRTSDGAIDEGLGWLTRGVPWVMLVHKPGPELLAMISQANYQTVKILQTQEGLSARLDALRKCWRVETVIHNDIKSDNVLIRAGRGPEADAVEARIVDWELVQLGDPAWDLAGALQDMLGFWVQSIPVAPGLTAAEMMAAATYPLAAVQVAFRALWAGYKAAAGLSGADASALLTRAVRFSAPRLIQSAYEMSHGSPALHPAAVILLQVGSNILDDPELAQVQLYGLHGGAILEMAIIHDDLGAALDAVQIESPERYVFRGEPRDLRAFPGPADGSPLLPILLESDLYGGLYTRPGPAPTAPGDPLAQRDLVAALSAANRGRGTWEPRWRIGEVDDDGRVAVTKDELTFWVEPGGLRPRDGRLGPGEWCRVRVAKELRGLMPGFYMAIGDPDEDDRRDDHEPLLRLYWHLTPAAAVTYMAEATTHLNAAGVPFRTKVVNDPALYQRADAGVLYFGRRHYGRLRVAIARVYEAVRGGLRPDVPLFARRLAPGLGLAEDPGNGMSFGQHRCHLIARALWRAFEAGAASREARDEALASAFREAGLDPLRPHLEPHAPDVYDFDPADPDATRGGRRGRAPRPTTPRGRARGRKVRRP